MKPKLKRALLIADIQRDFCAGGSLAVPDAEGILDNINKYIKHFSVRKLPVFVTRDWHPAKTGHFKKFGGRWPRHCVQNTKGAELHPRLKLTKETIVISKGMDPTADSYSAFDGRDPNDTPLVNLLKIFGTGELYIGGLATEYCVKYTALDALRAGFKVRILVDAVKGIDLVKGDSERAIEGLVSAGANKTVLKNLEK